MAASLFILVLDLIYLSGVERHRDEQVVSSCHLLRGQTIRERSQFHGQFALSTPSTHGWHDCEGFQNEVRPRMKGNCFMVRFADDFVAGFTLRSDAERVFGVLPKRFERFGLRIASEHAQQVWKRWLARRNSKDRMSWADYQAKVLELFKLPKPRIIHAF